MRLSKKQRAYQEGVLFGGFLTGEFKPGVTLVGQLTDALLAARESAARWKEMFEDAQRRSLRFQIKRFLAYIRERWNAPPAK